MHTDFVCVFVRMFVCMLLFARGCSKVSMCFSLYIENVVHKDNNQKKLVEAGALECIVEAMRNHSTSADVQENACGALGNIASSNGTCRVHIYIFLNIWEHTNVVWSCSYVYDTICVHIPVCMHTCTRMCIAG